MNIYENFHKAVSIRIGPTFDCIEDVVERYPKLAPPIAIVLIAGLPAWCALAQFVNSRR